MSRIERQTFSKDERLCSTKLIEELFDFGNVINTPLFRVLWIKSSISLPSPAQIAVTVPKKIFRLAVTRNLMKRRIREAYRKIKQPFYSFLEAEKIRIAFILIYRHKSPADFMTIEKSVGEVIRKLIDDIKQKQDKC